MRVGGHTALATAGDDDVSGRAKPVEMCELRNGRPDDLLAPEVELRRSRQREPASTRWSWIPSSQSGEPVRKQALRKRIEHHTERGEDAKACLEKADAAVVAAKEEVVK